MAPQLTPKTAATAFAAAWNRLEPDEFLALLAPDACYASQWVFEELQGSDAIGKYLRQKMESIRSNGRTQPSMRVMAELGVTRGGQDCVLMMQGSDEVKAVVVFETQGAHIKRYDMCIPQLMGARPSGVVPL